MIRKEKILEYGIVYKKNNKKRLAKLSKAWYSEHKDQLFEKHREYREINKDDLSIKKRKYREDNIEKQLLFNAKKRAIKYDLEFNIDITDIDVLKNCPLLEIEMEVNHNHLKDSSFTLDRIDNAKGYIKGNVWVISYKANRSKNNATIEEYEKIVNNFEKIINETTVENKNCCFCLKKIINRIKNKANSKKILFDIDIDYLKSIYPSNNKCPLLDIELKEYRGHFQYCSLSLDRIIPEKGYIKGNVIFLSHRANTIKNNLTLNEMKLLLKNWKKNY